MIRHSDRLTRSQVVYENSIGLWGITTGSVRNLRARWVKCWTPQLAAGRDDGVRNGLREQADIAVALVDQLLPIPRISRIFLPNSPAIRERFNVRDFRLECVQFP